MTALTPPSSTLPERRVLVAFLLFVLAGGGASVAIRITYGELAPFWSAAARFGLAGETITVNFLIGAALVLAGVLVGVLLLTKTRLEAIEECKDRSGQVLPRCV